MATVIEMPKLSDTMEEGGIANWLKKEGDPVEEGEAIVEIETDKATQEYESPEEGVLLKIIVAEGGSANLGEAIAVVGEAGEEIDIDALVGKGDAKAGSGIAETDDLRTSNDGDGNDGDGNDDGDAREQDKRQAEHRSGEKTASEGYGSDRSVVDDQDTKRDSRSPGSSSRNGQNASGRVLASPLARKLAADRGVELSSLEGSGPGGRIVKSDVESAPQGSSKAGDGGKARGYGQDPRKSLQPGSTAEDRAIPVSRMRKTIAKRLLAAKNDVPHFYLTVSADMSQMNAWRQKLNSAKAVASGDLPKVSVNDLVIMATAKALRQHPEINSSWQTDKIVQYGDVHVAMAVALPEGLVTPVIRHCDQLGVRDIASQSKYLGYAAKDGKLGNEDFAGGTFTISNLGMFGIEEFTAIINPPQAAILAVGATKTVPWVDDDGDLIVCSRMKMTLSCDHRVIDGALGAQFLHTLVGYLEDPLGMLV